MNEQELNKKLAEWAGFKSTDVPDVLNYQQGHKEWCYPNLRCKLDLPTFTQSLDACFKWLVPKLKHYELSNWAWKKHTGWAGIEKIERIEYRFAIADTPALALCLAIEKLIDKES